MLMVVVVMQRGDGRNDRKHREYVQLAEGFLLANC